MTFGSREGSLLSLLTPQGGIRGEMQWNQVRRGRLSGNYKVLGNHRQQSRLCFVTQRQGDWLDCRSLSVFSRCLAVSGWVDVVSGNPDSSLHACSHELGISNLFPRAILASLIHDQALYNLDRNIPTESYASKPLGLVQNRQTDLRRFLIFQPLSALGGSSKGTLPNIPRGLPAAIVSSTLTAMFCSKRLARHGRETEPTLHYISWLQKNTNRPARPPTKTVVTLSNSPVPISATAII